MARLEGSTSQATSWPDVALFVALGGSSYAAVKVNGGQYRQQHRGERWTCATTACAAKDIHNRTIQGADVALLHPGAGTNFAAGQLPRGEQGLPAPEALEASAMA